MTWTAEQAKRASFEGWGLVDTIDNGKAHAYLMVVDKRGAFKNHHEAGMHVVRLARQNSRFHQEALHAIMQSRVPDPVKPRKRA